MQWNQLVPVGAETGAGAEIEAGSLRGTGPAAVGLLRALVRPARGCRDGGRVRVRRSRGGLGGARQPVGGAVPPGEVGSKWLGAAGELRRSCGLVRDGAVSRHRSPRRGSGPADPGRLRSPGGLWGPPCPGAAIHRGWRDVDPCGRPQRGPHRRAARAGDPGPDRGVGRVGPGHGNGNEVRVQTGGGIRTEDDVAAVLGLGVARVVLGTAALEDPALAAALRPALARTDSRRARLRAAAGRRRRGPRPRVGGRFGADRARIARRVGGGANRGRGGHGDRPGRHARRVGSGWPGRVAGPDRVTGHRLRRRGIAR